MFFERCMDSKRNRVVQYCRDILTVIWAVWILAAIIIPRSLDFWIPSAY
jgi:hypothetical protein